MQQLSPGRRRCSPGIIQSPTAYDPVNHPAAARARRNLVLSRDAQPGLPDDEPCTDEGLDQPLPAAANIQAPQEPTVEGVDVGYFASWVQQQLVERYGAPRAFDGGLRVKTTLDLELQRAAEQAVNGYLSYAGDPTAALVAIENSTGEVRAMVGGRNYDETPFNLATEGERQPGSSFKAFDLAAALEDGISPVLDVDVQGQGIHRPEHRRARKVRRAQRRRRVYGRKHADQRDRLLRQLDLRRSRAEGRHPPDRPPRPSTWASRRRCRPTPR